jgi:hypothetical protein
MPALNINDLNNGKKDLDHIAEIATSENLTAIDRFGRVKPTAQGAINTLKAFNVRGPFVSGTEYAMKDVYTDGNIAYVAVNDHIGSTVAADLAAGKVTVHQGATREELSAASGASEIGFVQGVDGGLKRSVQDKLFEIVSLLDCMTPQQITAARNGSVFDLTAPIQAALNSGATYLTGCGLSYRVKSLVLPAGVTLDGNGGRLLSSGTSGDDVIATGGAGATLQDWTICSDVPGARKGRYGVLVSHPRTRLRSLYIRDVTYTAVFNNAEGTTGFDIESENCGWDVISNYSNAKNSTFRSIKGVRNGRSLISTDSGAQGILVDGFEAIDNGLDEIADQHKDVLHFELAADCIFKNGVIRYTAAYTGGTIAQTWAMMRWNASTNCRIENVNIKLESSANGKLLLGLVDTAGAEGNTNCAAININVDATAISDHQLIFWNYDGASRFKLIDGLWRGYTSIRSGSAGGNAFSSIKGIEADGPGSGQFLLSDYVTQSWDIERLKIAGYFVAFNLNGFQDSNIRGCEIVGAQWNVFNLLNSNVGAAYQPNGGVLANNIIRGTTGTVLQTNNQQTRPLIFAHNSIDGSANTGLDTSGGIAGATLAHVKAIGNVVGVGLTTVQSGENAPGLLSANMNTLIS